MDSSNAVRVVTRGLIAAAALLVGSVACTHQATPDSGAATDIEALLPGDYLGDGSRGAVYHRIVALDVPTFGGPVFYHHISRESFGGPAAQRKVYAFEADLTMRSTVVLTSGVTLDRREDMALDLDQLSEDQLLRFPDSCKFQWAADEDAYIARVERERCSYASPAFGGSVSPEMTYRLSPCGLAIEEAIYREDGRPVFPPSKVDNERVDNAVGMTLPAGC